MFAFNIGVNIAVGRYKCSKKTNFKQQMEPLSSAFPNDSYIFCKSATQLVIC